MQPLTIQERKILCELTRLAGSNAFVTARQLRDEGFADFVTSAYASDVGYPQSLQSRKLQILRDKGYITMRKGTYTVMPE